MKKQILIVSLLAAVIVVAGCTNPFAKRTPKTESQAKTLGVMLEQQSEMHKFSNAEDLKNFFANRPQGSSSNSAARSESYGLGVAKDAAAPQATGLGGGGGYSTTNIQVAGVDESDIAKTDGSYIYTVSDKNIVIMNAVPAADAAIVATIATEGRPQELYIDKDKLIAFGYEEVVYTDAMPTFRPMNPSTFLSVYDISDPKAPKLLKNLKFEGSYTASRLIDGRVYFVSTTYNFYPLGEALLPAVYENGEKISGDKSSDRYAYPDVYYIDTPSSYNTTSVSVIDLNKLDEPLYSNVYFMPSGQTLYASRGNLYLSYTKFLSDYELRMTVAREMIFNRLPEKDRALINQISSLDSSILNDDEKAAKINQVIETYIYRLPQNEQEQVVKSLNEEFKQRYESLYKELETTVIHKIALEDGKLAYKGAGEVSGHVLNQFSMDEDKGMFRIATTRGQSWVIPFPIIANKMIVQPSETKESYNNVFVLDENMKQVGALENLALGERIYSARFMGDRAYVVTFKQTDPLFVLDMSDASAPKMIGQIKIPGFSSYLHPYSDTILIGVGKEATDKGAQGVEMGGLKVSLFDVSDPAAPKEIKSLGIGGVGSDTPVLYDHKAFLFSADKQLLVLPASITAKSSQNYLVEFQGALVLRVSADTLAERGRISIETTPERRAAGYGTWESIQRALYIGDNLYSVAQGAIQINNLESLAKVKTIALPQSAQNVNPGQPMPLSTPAAGVR